MPDSTQKMMRNIRALGWAVRVTNGGHLKLTHPASAYPVFTGASPSDFRSWQALLSEMKKAIRGMHASTEERPSRGGR